MRAAKEVYKGLGIPDRLGYTQTQATAHCAFPTSVQGPEVQAFVNKFLTRPDEMGNLDNADPSVAPDGTSMPDGEGDTCASRAGPVRHRGDAAGVVQRWFVRVRRNGGSSASGGATGSGRRRPRERRIGRLPAAHRAAGAAARSPAGRGSGGATVRAAALRRAERRAAAEAEPGAAGGIGGNTGSGGSGGSPGLGRIWRRRAEPAATAAPAVGAGGRTATKTPAPATTASAGPASTADGSSTAATSPTRRRRPSTTRVDAASTLPHDWSIELAVQPELAGGQRRRLPRRRHRLVPQDVHGRSGARAGSAS